MVAAGRGEETVLDDGRGDLVSAVVGVGGHWGWGIGDDAGEEITQIVLVVNETFRQKTVEIC